MTRRRGDDALAWMRNQHYHPTQSWYRQCLKVTRLSFGDVPGGIATAGEAWDAVPAEFRHPWHKGKGSYKKAPRGSVFVWQVPGGAGHIVLVAGDGMCWSNDVKVPGKISYVRMKAITDAWPNHRPMGWMEKLNGVRIVPAPK